MSEKADGASETFGLSAADAQEAKDAGIDLANLGLAPTQDVTAIVEPSEADAAKTTEAQEPKQADALSADTTVSDDSEAGPISREDLKRILAERDKEWQSRKDREVYLERRKLEDQNAAKEADAERARVLAMDDEDRGQWLADRMRKAEAPDAAAISRDTATRVYRDEVLAPIRTHESFAALSDEDFAKEIRAAPIRQEAPGLR